MPVEMHLMPEEVRMSAAEKLMHTGRQFNLEVVHLRTAETLVQKKCIRAQKKLLAAAYTLLLPAEMHLKRPKRMLVAAPEMLLPAEMHLRPEVRLSGAEILFYAEMHLMPEEVPLTTAEKLVPSEMEVSMVAAEMLVLLKCT